ncbi:GNAT family N-acetyltransferase [Leptolyngbya ohadii]|uniref:GNAT family N-acetyltransferase n=1 Tax=Leptolyngbya ohadii TaxID=1962290 RepID=UPI000B59FF6B|nr:GNAT family N-acetyltransferase [Leptolyngbya ohadii]
MTQEIHLIRILNLNTISIDDLIEESLLQEFQFVRRLAEEYKTGKNRFNRTGEALFVVLSQGETIAIGGLNQDPYFTPSGLLGEIERVGRLRHLYVRSDWRRKGIGRRLVERLIHEAKPHYQRLTLRTDSPEADKFYQKLGFRSTLEWECTTHYLELEDV